MRLSAGYEPQPAASPGETRRLRAFAGGNTPLAKKIHSRNATSANCTPIELNGSTQFGIPLSPRRMSLYESDGELPTVVAAEVSNRAGEALPVRCRTVS